MLPSILGNHEDEILYWAGKEVARKFPIFGIDELPQFFQEAGWGPLQLDKSSKDEAFYSLQNDVGINVHNRSCRLEAGFIAEQYQKFNGYLTECYGESNVQDGIIHFQVKWDSKTKIGV